MRHSLLDARHREAGARMVPFGGWEMPLRYGSVLDEHRACRERAVTFDVSHLGSLRVTGPGGAAALDGLLTNDLSRIRPGRAQYTHLLDDEAGVVDDIIVWWVDDEDVVVLPNASNTAPALEAVTRAVAEATGGGAVVADVTGERALLAVQGPDAPGIVAAALRGVPPVGRFDVAPGRFPGGEAGLVAGTGYTGEEGVELFVPAAAAEATWDVLVAAGAVPAGLGARDTLRLEMGYPLHGHELGPGITPLQAGLGWVVGWKKPSFRGRPALLAERERGVARRLMGIVLADRQIPRDGCPVLVDGEVAGKVTSGNLSPTLGVGVALAFLPPGIPAGTPLEVDIRGRRAAATSARPPFVTAGSQRTGAGGAGS